MTTTRQRPRVPRAVIDGIADEVRAEGLGGDDLHDIADQIDWGADPTDWTGAGEALHAYLLVVTAVLDTSAAGLIAEAHVVLGT